MQHPNDFCINYQRFSSINSDSLVYQSILPTNPTTKVQSMTIHHPSNIYPPHDNSNITVPSIELPNKQLYQNSLPTSLPSQQTQMTGRKRFSPEEDALLISLISCYGQDWTKISSEMKTRTSRQCRERWRFFLCPDLDNNEWSTDENKLLIAKYNEIGPHWKKLQTFFPKRSYINIRNHYRNLQNARKRKNEILNQSNHISPNRQKIDNSIKIQKITAFHNFSNESSEVDAKQLFTPPQSPTSTIPINLLLTRPNTIQIASINKQNSPQTNRIDTKNKIEIPHIWHLLNNPSQIHHLSCD